MTTEYNLAAVRSLLLTAFTAEELPRFCRDRPYLEPVCTRFGPHHGLDDMVDELIEYARTRRLLGELLADVQEYNPGQHAAFAARLTELRGEDDVAAGVDASVPRAGRVLLALLVVDLGLLFVAGWCLFGHDPALVAYVATVFTVVSVLVALAAALLVVRRPAAWEDVLRSLGTDRRSTYTVLLVTAGCVALAALSCLGRPPPEQPPTAYIALLVDNGPVPEGRDFDELRAAVQAELAHTLPNAALSLRVFGLDCDDTRLLVDFERGNADEVAAALGGVGVVPQSDLTEAVRQELDNLLAEQGTQPHVLVVVTWGNDGCGGDLNAALALYTQRLGSAVSVSVISLGEPPAVVARPGVSVLEVDDVQDVRDALRAINRVLEIDTWSPRTPVFRVTPER